MSDIELTVNDGPSSVSVSVTADAETEARRQRMRNIVAKLTDYMVTYSAQPGYEDYSDKTLIDDVLYGLGIALEPEKHHAAQGYDIFRQKLMLHLRLRSTKDSGFDIAVNKGMVNIDGDNIAYGNIAGMYQQGNGHGLQLNEHLEPKREEILKHCSGIAEHVYELQKLLAAK